MKNQAEDTPSPDELPIAVSRLVAIRRTLIGFLVCVGTAVVITAVLRHVRGTESLPLVFLLVVGLVAHWFGTSSALLGLLGGAFVFAAFLFPPVGSLNITDEAARTNVVMMLLFGMAVAYFYGATKPGDGSKHRQS